MNTKKRTELFLKRILSVFILISMLLLVSMVALEYSNAVADVQHKGVIRITSSGDIEGSDKISRNGNVYTLKDDIISVVKYDTVFINIDCDGIIFDGAGKTIRGADGGIAIGIYEKRNVIIKNMRIVDFQTGIEICDYFPLDLESPLIASGNQVIDSYFETRYEAISLYGVKEVISGNTFISKSGNAIMFQANKTTVIDNIFKNCGLSLYEPSISNVFSNNTINDKPLVVFEGKSNKVIDDAAQVILINCKNMVVQNVADTDVNRPIQIHLFGTTNTKITNCKANVALQNSNSNLLIGNEFSTGNGQPAVVSLGNSHNNTITQNSIVGINRSGIILSNSAYNKIEKNNISTSSSSALVDCAIITLECYKNYIYENNMTSEGIGLNLGGEYNVFFKNNVSQGRYNIFMNDARYNDILGNKLSGANEYAICLNYADFNNFVWNNFIDNTKIYEEHKVLWKSFSNLSYCSENNKWDNGIEGNYWSDYMGHDTNGDGIGKSPYVVYENFVDNYPLTRPYDTSKIQVIFEQWDGFSKNFPLMTTIAIASGAIIIVIVAIVLLWRFKNVPKTKIVG
jgi:parallel beta-helix repeat protein